MPFPAQFGPWYSQPSIVRASEDWGVSRSTAVKYRKLLQDLSDYTGAVWDMRAVQVYALNNAPLARRLLNALTAYFGPYPELEAVFADILRSDDGGPVVEGEQPRPEARRRPEDPTLGYRAWLTAAGKSEQTVEHYAACVRTILRRSSLEAALAGVTGTTRMQYATAWRSWRTYQITAGDAVDATTGPITTNPPIHLHELLAWVLGPRGWSARRLSRLRWEDLRVTAKPRLHGEPRWDEVRFSETGDDRSCSANGEVVRWWILEARYAELLGAHREWACPQVPQDPVFPVAPGSALPMTEGALREIARLK